MRYPTEILGKRDLLKLKIELIIVSTISIIIIREIHLIYLKIKKLIAGIFRLLPPSLTKVSYVINK